MLNVKKLLTKLVSNFKPVTVDMTMTAVANGTFQSAKVTVMGSVASYYFHFKTNTALSAGTLYTIGTIPAAYTPMTGVGVVTGADNVGMVQSGGVIQIRTNITKASGTNLYFGGYAMIRPNQV